MLPPFSKNNMRLIMNIKNNFKNNKKSVITLSIVLAVSLLIGILVDVITPKYWTSLTVAFSGSGINESAQADALEAGYALNVKLEEEGIVLLKNDGTLPLQTDAANKTKINVFGVRSAHLVLNSAGSAAGSVEGAVTLKDSLEAAGFEVNEALWSKLEGTFVKDSTEVEEGGTSEAVNELDIGEYTGDISFENAKAFSEYAIVTFSRLGGEGHDQARTGMGENGDRSYLELSANEEALLKELQTRGFKTIVLINSSYAMELGPLDEYGVAAALWIGGPGVKGTTAVGRVLNGSVNPSGRLVDTYAYDLTTAASYIASDSYKVMSDDEQIGGYTNYSEGIYVGYRWYETAEAEGFWTGEYAAKKWGVSSYEDVVQYPFGYGLSYTSFEQKFVGSPEYDEASHTLTFEVEVKNTGSEYRGKNVVQLYLETPYTDGGVEKSKVVLCAFGKTDLLATNGSSYEDGDKTVADTQTLTLTVCLDDFASYDETANGGAGAYILDAGSYKFYLSNNAHSWAEISPSDSDRFCSFNLDRQIVFGEDNARSGDVSAAVNRLSGMDVNNGEKIVTLSRTDAFANAEEAVFSPMSDITVSADSDTYAAFVTNAGSYGEYLGDLWDDAVGQPTHYKFADLIDTERGYVDYDSEIWDAFLSQLTVDELEKLAGTGGWSTAKIESIEKERTSDIDGPFGLSNIIKNNMGQEVSCVSYCSEVVTASTWNTELVEELGAAVAAEANATGVAGWYAPGANTHRTPFGGRNPEYFSEDVFLSGKMCASEVDGALANGLYVYIKHFAFNEIEANRTSKQNCVMTEQTAREIYLRPFEMAVKNDSYDEEGNKVSYGATGLMASYMWERGSWCGSDYDLMTGILRNEWGFKGMVVTDNAGVGDISSWINVTTGSLAGTDLILVYKTSAMDSSVRETQAGITALKKAAKNILYTVADAASRRTSAANAGTDWWQIIYIGLNVVFFGLAAVMMALIAVKLFRPKTAKSESVPREPKKKQKKDKQ